MLNILNFKNNILNFKNKKFIFGLLFVIGILIAISIYYYKYIVLPRLNQKYVTNKEFVSNNNNESESSHATLYYFYTNWCPNCKTAKPQLDALKDETQGNVKGINIIFKDIDCEQDTTMADKFKVSGYPTIKLIYKNTIYDYDAKPDKDTLIQFLNSVL